MCSVTRVTNSCGHINDHVEMVCRDAKPVSPSQPGSLTPDNTKRSPPTSTTRYPDLTKLARPISPGPPGPPGRPALYVQSAMIMTYKYPYML